VTLVALVVSFALISLTDYAGSFTFFAAAAALIVSMYWTMRYFQLGRQLRILCFSRDKE
jgi:hypothetical protein